MESVFLITAIIGFIEFIKALNSNDWETAEIIVGAAIIGGLCGYFHIDNLVITSGIQAGLAATGTYKISKNISGIDKGLDNTIIKVVN